MKIETLTNVRGAAASSVSVAVSVLIAAHGRPETVVRAVRSALDQRATGLGVEVVLVVDGCAATAAAVRGLEDPALVKIESAVNLGVARSRNRGLELARGELIVHLDADDALEPGALEAIVAAFAGKPHVGLVYGDLIVEDGDGRVRGPRREPDFPGHRGFLEAPFDVPLIAYRKGVGVRAGGLDEGAVRCDNASLIGRISRTHSVRKLDRALVRHRVDGKNRSLKYRPEDCGACASATSCRLAELRRKRLALDSHRLRKLSLVLTTRCNLDCGYCFTRRYKWDLSTEECLRLLVQGRDQGADRVAFTGGEPSLHDGFDTIISSSADLGYEVLVISNGWNWPDERIKLFTSMPRARLAVSLEGKSPAQHDAIRGPGSHAALLRFMERVRAANPRFPISGIVVATADNLGELGDICAWAMEELKLESLRIDRVAPSGNAEANEEFSPEATRRYLEAARAVNLRWPGRVEAITESFSGAGCPLYVNLYEDAIPDLQVFADGTVPVCVYMHLDRPTRLGMAQLDVAELLERRNCSRVKTIVDEAFRDRERQIERKGVFTCVECLERRNLLDRAGKWPGKVKALPVVSAPARAPIGRPRSAAERCGAVVRSLVVG